MGFIDEALECMGIPVHVSRGVKINTVITPVPVAGELCNRHHFDHGDPKSSELVQLSDSGIECSFMGKRPNMDFIDYLAMHVNAHPVLIMPSIRRRIDDL